MAIPSRGESPDDEIAFGSHILSATCRHHPPTNAATITAHDPTNDGFRSASQKQLNQVTISFAFLCLFPCVRFHRRQYRLGLNFSSPVFGSGGSFPFGAAPVGPCQPFVQGQPLVNPFGGGTAFRSSFDGTGAGRSQMASVPRVALQARLKRGGLLLGHFVDYISVIKEKRKRGAHTQASGIPQRKTSPSSLVWDDTAHSTDDAGHVGEHVTITGRSSGSYIHGWRMPP
ncbi:hypothetical protein CMUS01_07906 [Colletotrichum musicola]|uniref:Uncharacterized protein n=1 Tax=Colletotrichum musicola TaxID=2175873 RepID=A0A8H6NE68_9PEZI|nr:hypothetical protein CMUS01_07906 [Colletotrichum musicola]